jgi:hypothetical protein
MSDKVRVIHPANLPMRPPLLMGVVLWLALDHFHANDVVRGVAWTLYGLWCLVVLVSLVQCEHVNIREVLKDADRKHLC